jgi:hypothetical protein
LCPALKVERGTAVTQRTESEGAGAVEQPGENPELGPESAESTEPENTRLLGGRDLSKLFPSLFPPEAATASSAAGATTAGARSVAQPTARASAVPGAAAGATTQSPPFADPRLPVYRDTLRITSDLLLRTDWRKLKTSPYILESAIKAIRDAIRYLEDLREKQIEGSEQLEQVLEPSYAALTTLYKALDLGATGDQAGPFFEQIAQGRAYLQKAIYAFPLEQINEANTAPIRG